MAAHYMGRIGITPVGLRGPVAGMSATLRLRPAAPADEAITTKPPGMTHLIVFLDRDTIQLIDNIESFVNGKPVNVVV